MKKIISNEEIIEKAKKWLASYSKEELNKKVEEELQRLELENALSLEWMDNEARVFDKLPNSVNCETISIDEREFAYTSLDEPISNKESSISINYVEKKVFIDLEAA